MKWVNLFFLILLFSISACKKDELDEQNWQLTWEDNFNGSEGELPDASKWNFDIGRGPKSDGWGNDELQSYTKNPENISLDGKGNLRITALNKGGFTSARITTKDKFEQAFGRFEAKIKMPWGPGIWPAFWLLGANIDEVPWPQCGEIDIMEYRGQQPNVVHGTVHGPGYSGDSSVTSSFGFENDRFDLDFHVFAVEWDVDYINYYVDNLLYQQIKPDDLSGEWVYNHPFFIILNVAVGGKFVGFPTTQTPFPQNMLVDWVRVYKASN